MFGNEAIIVVPLITFVCGMIVGGILYSITYSMLEAKEREGPSDADD